MTGRQFGFETRMLHAGHIPDAATGARAVPIYQTTSYVFESADFAAQLFDLKQYGNIYTRIMNPTTAVFEERLASLENATGCVATASGQAAQFIAIATLLKPGDEVVSSSHLYGGTYTQFAHTLKKLSVDVKFVDPDRIENFEAAVTSKTKALYGETIGNPKGSILDMEALSNLAKSKKIPLIVDNTFATPYLCRPIDFGADIVLHSATKFIGGHGNSIAGAILESGNFDYSRYPAVADPAPSYHGLKFYETFGHYGFLMKARMETLRDVGACLSPFNAFLLIQGLETLSIRMDRHVANAKAIAEFLKTHKRVEWVAYAGLPDSPYHAGAKKYLPKGPGAVFAFGVKGGREAGKKFIESLQIFSHLANVGDARSLVIHPASTTHQQLSDEELVNCGVGPEMIRLSVGLETLEDLIWDLDRALSAS
ncbi:O-acetylhomoserine aminocarboxypropyltransferase/cysteine synthase [bacterium]|nr:O-acetylhomoserine aminocarboxypropyltransferase/cysteine synthase [bacterium]